MEEFNFPFDRFDDWLKEASELELDANAMTLSTVDRLGRPSSRIVLFKGFHKKEFVFYTNTQSNKGIQLGGNPFVSLCFHWKSLKRQVRIQGEANQIDARIADEYFATRDRGSQFGAWASDQSRVLNSRTSLGESIELLTKKFLDSDIPRPDYWSGFRVKPENFEFWQDMPHRLHLREFYELTTDGNWTETLLFP